MPQTAPSKTPDTESFPVAAWFLPQRVRADVLAYYDFARRADDIADDAGGEQGDALAGMAAMERAFQHGWSARDSGSSASGGSDDHVFPLACSAARHLAVRLRARGMSDRSALDMLAAFRRDIVGETYQTWDDLVGYCRFSAMPVGRFLLELHGETEADVQASDALCAALQILNHIQDCGKDHDELGRVYLPSDFLAAHGIDRSCLSATESSTPLRCVLDRCLDGADAFLQDASRLPETIMDRRLRAQSTAAIEAGRRLSRRLRVMDPLSGRVDLSYGDRSRVAIVGALALMKPSARRKARS